jgi:malate dehydrogenase (oxaloacetate-decarboxylating)
MPEGTYELVQTADGYMARITARGAAVLATPTINRGTAFTLAERRELGLTGLLPSGVSTLDGQLRRTYAQYRAQTTDLRKWVYLANLRDRNEVLFYRLLSEHIEEMLPVVYTPTVGLAIERFSHEFRRPRGGVYLSVDHPEEVETALRNTGLGAEDVDLLVATDSEGILGIGDQGVGGIEISVGKLAVYTAAAGIHPDRVLPVVLDMGTDNLALLNDEMYLGERHARVRDERYDQLIDTYVQACGRLFPNAMLHWEDFGATNARRILDRYAEQCCTFNDDMQGTAAVVLAAAFSGVRAAGTRMRDQRVVIHGAGTAGLGIADMMREEMIREGLSPEEATRRFWALGRRGIIADDRIDHLYDFQVPYARTWDEVKDWGAPGSRPGLADVVRHVRPTMLIGTSTQAGAFTEAIVRDMAAHTQRPIIMPLSNPTSKCEALPADVLAWTDGRALVATGSPFAPVEHDGLTYQIAQANNALVSPRARARGDGGAGVADHPGDDLGSGRRRRAAVGRDQARRAAAAAGARPAPGLGGGGHRGGAGCGRRGPRPGSPDQPHRAGPPGHVAPGVPACRGQAAVMSTARTERKRLWQR